MNQDTPTQLVLGVHLQDEARFSNFFVNAANTQLLASLQGEDSTRQFIYFWGNSGSGRTHLLQALCHQQAELGNAVLYLPLGEREKFGIEILQGANTLSMVCLDDVDELSGDADWEAALFNLYNELLESDTRLFIAASAPPQSLSLGLPDLQSRLQSCLVYQMLEPGDEGKGEILRLRAANRGINIEKPVAEFIVQRAERSLSSLMAILDKLDRITLEKGRRVTIPLVKEIMQW
jgi:DnaA family protein